VDDFLTIKGEKKAEKDENDIVSSTATAASPLALTLTRSRQS
jgi:hypothetical protein